MTLVIAVHKISIGDSDEPLTHTGKYDAQGSPIMRRVSHRVKSGEFVKIDDAALLQRLLRMGAVREPTDGEIAVRERKNHG